MYVGIDVGGTKTLVGVLDQHGVLKEVQKIPTPKDYPEFLQKVAEVVESFATKDYKAAAIGVAATHIDRIRGIAKDFGNLPWEDVAIQEDFEKLLDCPVVIENDAKLACLSEAMLRKDKPKVLYVTISTGIGYALTANHKIDTNIGDGGGKLLMLEHRGKLQPWESFASGHAIVQRFGKTAKEIIDVETWQTIAHDLAAGFLELIAVTEPDVVVVGGSVGHYFERLKPHLERELKKHETPLLTIPPLEEAQRPEQAVLYGCYDVIQERYGRNR